MSTIDWIADWTVGSIAVYQRAIAYEITVYILYLASIESSVPACLPAFLPVLSQAKTTIAVAVHRISCIKIEGERKGKDLESSSKLS